ncbi:hypothetical protein NLJ89_g152 [Agrocybe chaxingu]|uniref:Metal homeostatis protein bsd2 n=1 Tax=Agrocybe chaxingu TaxID=84603 RepID=A0A9W8N2H6_9AGAR|nr:hypothetical protein NLJ89_g152 [Agrocybe chaxingu]
MAHRYAPVPNPGPDRRATQHDREVEMQAAFDYSDDEDDEHNASESQPLNPTPTSAAAPVQAPPARTPGLYNFETVDYDYPPPGSPPLPSATALPNDIGNSNGLVPSFSPSQNLGPRRMWFQRAAAAVLPASVLTKVGLAPRRLSGPVGGGTNNDGVFANVTAKPTPPVRVQDGDDTYLVPEDTRQEAPPSYASAQADAVPPYWETTVHAPFSPDSMGEMVIDSLPTGSLFSFCWNLLVSVSFQFVGFLLTYLLHTSHAARLGSRAGLGITLIQYGFALRSRLDSSDDNDMSVGWGELTDPNAPTVEGHHGHHHGLMSNVSWATPISNMTEEQTNVLVADATTEWLSFFLMTVGWFVLLTSLLGFWRVKRWERGILASQRDSSTPTPAPRPNPNIFSQIESTFGLHGSPARISSDKVRVGPRHNADDEVLRAHALAERGESRQDAAEIEPMIPGDPNDPERARLIAAVIANEQRLQRDLREAGLL